MRERATGTEGDGGARRSVDGSPPDPAAASWVRAALDGALRGAVAAVGGLAVVAVIALVLWALTPSAGTGPLPMLRAAVSTFVLAHFGSLTIGSAQLTLTPLLLTGVYATVLVFAQRRATVGVADDADEAVSVAAGAVAYAAVVCAVVAVLAPPGAQDYRAVLGALLLAGVCLLLGALAPGHALRGAALARLPSVAVEGLRAGLAATMTALATAAAVVAAALVLSFTDATDLASALGEGFGAGLGLLLVCLGYLPNAIGAALGYVTGTGFVVGGGEYSPFGSIPADLPPFPLLAAVPSTSGSSLVAMLALAGVPLAGVAAGWSLVHRLGGRRDRMIGVGVAAACAGLLCGGYSWLSTGGVAGGAWPVMGSSGWQVGLVITAGVLVVAGVWVLAAGAGSDAVTGQGDEGPDGRRPASRPRGGRRRGASAEQVPATEVTVDDSKDAVDDESGPTSDLETDPTADPADNPAADGASGEDAEGDSDADRPDGESDDR